MLNNMEKKDNMRHNVINKYASRITMLALPGTVLHVCDKYLLSCTCQRRFQLHIIGLNDIIR